MQLNYSALKSKPRTFLSLTSLEVAEFEALLPSFEAAWNASLDKEFIAEKEGERVVKRSRLRRFGGGRVSRLRGLEEKLLFILMYFKVYPLQEVQGFFWGLSQAQANAWIHRLTPVLQQALGYEKQLPTRAPSDLAQVLGECASLEFFIDGTERRIGRPKDPEKQKQNYSGKKKGHTRKNLVVSDKTNRIHGLSPTCEGKKHDKRIADEAKYHFPRGSTLYQDTGFQGYVPGTSAAPEGAPEGASEGASEGAPVQILQPKKKPRGKENHLSEEEKQSNRAISAVRIKVEHAIGGVKRCRIAKDLLRNTKESFDDLVMETACGLHNLRLALRPVPLAK